MDWFITWLDHWSTPVFFVFLVIIGGYYLGQIRIADLSLDLAGVLILSILFGAFLTTMSNEHLINLYNDDFQSNMKFLSSFGTAIFISVIGVSSGYSFSKDIRTNKLLFFGMGIVMILTGVVLVCVIHRVDQAIDYSTLLGIFCGAMTSTPGLATICEAKTIDSSLATMGYGCSYLFGVIGVVLFVQVVTKRQTRGIKSFSEKKVESNGHPDFYGIIQIAVTIIGGYLLGTLEIPCSDFSLGFSGGILCVGIFIGYTIAKANPTRIIPVSNLSVLRGLGLVLFFVGSGIPAGIQLVSSLNIKWIIYGICMTIFPMLLGYIITLLTTQNNSRIALCVVCGGMTSTPAMGVLLRKENITVDPSAYSMAYTGALIAMIIVMRSLVA